MKRKRWLLLVLPALVMLLTTLAPQEAHAQYYGGGGYGGPPPPGRGGYGRPRWGFRHRVHAYVGGQLQGFIVMAQVNDYSNTGIEGYLSHGGGGGLFGGIRLGPFFSLELNWGITYHDDDFTAGTLDSLYMMTFTLDGKIHIPTRGPLEPFFQAGIGFAYLGVSYGANCLNCDTADSVFAKGPAFNVGGGVDFWLSPFFSLGGRLLYRGLYFTKTAYSANGAALGANFVNGVSIDVNIQFHF